QSENRRIGRIDFAVDRRIRDSRWQQIRCGVDRSLNFLFGDIDVEIEIELKRDERTTERARGRHLLQTGDLAELTLERRSDGGSHYLRTGSRIKRLNLNRRVVNLRKRRNRKLAIRNPANEKDAHHQKCGGDRPQDKRPRKTHGFLPPEWP